MGRPGLNRAAVVAAAGDIIDREGFGNLTMAGLAKRLGVALPSLYTHVRSLEHLRRELALVVTEELSRRMGEAIQGRAGRDAVFALAGAYRDYVLRCPGRYAMAMAARPAPSEDDARYRDAALKCAGVVYSAVRGYGVAEPALTDAARFLRAALHGFVSIETQGGFTLSQNLSPAFDALMAGVDRALASWPRP